MKDRLLVLLLSIRGPFLQPLELQAQAATSRLLQRRRTRLEFSNQRFFTTRR